MKVFEFQIQLSKRGLPCLWESGGGASNTGDSQIIAGSDFGKKTPIYIRMGGHLSCGNHALVPIVNGDYVINTYHHRKDFRISIYRIQEINIENKKAIAELVNKFSNGEWDKPLPEAAEVAVEAAKAKAMHYHCRRPYYISSLSPNN